LFWYSAVGMLFAHLRARELMDLTMPVQVTVPRPLRSQMAGLAEVMVEADTVAQVLQVLEGTYPSLTPYLRDEKGVLLPKVNFYVNDEHVRYRQGLQTPLHDGDHVYIVPFVSGG